MSSTNTTVSAQADATNRQVPRQFRTLHRYWRLLSHYLRSEWPRVALLGLILVCTIGVQVIAPLLASEFVDRAADGEPLRGLLVLALLTMIVALLGQVAGVAEAWVAENIGWIATNALRADLLAHVLRLDASYHTTHTPGELIERVDGDVSILARFFSRFVVYVVGNALLIVAILALLVRLDWRVGLGMSAFVAAGLVVMLRIRAAAAPAWIAEREASAGFYGFLSEYLAGTEDVRSSGAASFVMRRCAGAMRTWMAAWTRSSMWGYAVGASSQLLFAFGTAAAFALSAMQFRSGALTIGAVYLVFQYTAVLSRPAEQLRNEVQDLQQADASIARVEGMLGTVPQIIGGSGDLPAGLLSVEMDQVTFSYVDASTVLHDVTVRIDAGKVLGIVGRTGSGKTTLTRLLVRFVDPDVGVVRVGGVDIRTLRLDALRARIGVVSQEVHLFNASVRDNLTLFDEDVPDGKLIDLLTSLGLGGWLGGLPNGLSTRIGTGGVGLSAGEAQLLACARVFLRDPDIVILDEASSRLDPATERLLHDALARLLEGRTGILIAHRLDTIALADDVLVLEDGRVREHGERLALAANPASRFSELLRIAGAEVAS